MGATRRLFERHLAWPALLLVAVTSDGLARLRSWASRALGRFEEVRGEDPAGIARATELLAVHGLPDDPNWKDRPEFVRLADADREELTGHLGELLLLTAHARWQEARFKPGADSRAAAAELPIGYSGLTSTFVLARPLAWPTHH